MHRFSKGFTLIELIIVIAIIGILAAVIIAVLNPVTQIHKAQDAGRKTALKNVQNALEQYYSDHGAYPVAATGCGSWMTGIGECWSISNGSSNLFGANAVSYIPLMPQDPVQAGTDCTSETSRNFVYYSAAGVTYILSAKLELSSDPSIAAGQPNVYTAVSPEPCTVHNYKLVNQQ